MRQGLALAAAVIAVPAVALSALAKGKAASKPAPSRDVTGAYEAQGKAGGSDHFSIDVAQGDGTLSIAFLGEFGIRNPPHTCDCQLTGTPSGRDTWALTGDAKGTFGIYGDKIAIELERPPECCGADYDGAPDFKIAVAKKAAACTAKTKAPFRTANGDAIKAGVNKGEKIEAFPTGAEEPDDLVVARVAGRHKTAGFLDAKVLACPAVKKIEKPAAPEAPAGDSNGSDDGDSDAPN